MFSIIDIDKRRFKMKDELLHIYIDYLVNFHLQLSPDQNEITLKNYLLSWETITRVFLSYLKIYLHYPLCCLICKMNYVFTTPTSSQFSKKNSRPSISIQFWMKFNKNLKPSWIQMTEFPSYWVSMKNLYQFQTWIRKINCYIHIDNIHWSSQENK